MREMARRDDWVHPWFITEFRGINVTTLRALVRAGELEERPAPTYPYFEVRVPPVKAL